MTYEFRFGRLLLLVLLIDVLAIGGFAYALQASPGSLSSILPGTFGPGLDKSFTGNFLFIALLALFSGAILTLIGSLGVLRRVVGDADAGNRADLRAGISGARWAARLGALSLAVGLALFSWSLARANAGGTPLFNVENVSVNSSSAGLFVLDEIAGAILLDVPEIYDLHAGALKSNAAHPFMPLVSVIFRALVGLWFFSGLLGFWRSRRLIDTDAPVVAEPVAAAASGESFLMSHGDGRHAQFAGPVFADHQVMHEEYPAPEEHPMQEAHASHEEHVASEVHEYAHDPHAPAVHEGVEEHAEAQIGESHHASPADFRR